MSYINEFLIAFKRGMESPVCAEFPALVNAKSIRKTFKARSRNINVKKVEALRQVAKFVDQNRQEIGAESTSQCHIVCDDFMRNCNLVGLDLPGLAFVTIGDVLIDTKPLYGCSVDVVSEELVNPQKENKQLNMHFWVTCSDMTIIDIALPYNLKRRGHFELADFIGTPFLYDPSNGIHDVQYVPMIVDNHGPQKVDDLRRFGT